MIIGIAGIGVAWFQWYNSDKLALKAMGARDVTPEEMRFWQDRIDRDRTTLKSIAEKND